MFTIALTSPSTCPIASHGTVVGVLLRQMLQLVISKAHPTLSHHPLTSVFVIYTGSADAYSAVILVVNWR